MVYGVFNKLYTINLIVKVISLEDKEKLEDLDIKYFCIDASNANPIDLEVNTVNSPDYYKFAEDNIDDDKLVIIVDEVKKADKEVVTTIENTLKEFDKISVFSIVYP